MASADSNPFNHASVIVLGDMPPVGVKLESEPWEEMREGVEEEKRRREGEEERGRRVRGGLHGELDTDTLPHAHLRRNTPPNLLPSNEYPARPPVTPPSTTSTKPCLSPHLPEDRFVEAGDPAARRLIRARGALVKANFAAIKDHLQGGRRGEGGEGRHHIL